MPVLIFIIIWMSLIKPCYADTQLVSNFYFSLKQNDYSELLLKQKISGQESYIIPNWKIEQPYKSEVQNAQFFGLYDLQFSLNDEKLSELNYNLKIESGTLRLGQIITDTIIEKNVGGVIGHIYLKGECHGITISSLQPLLVRGKLNLVSQVTQLAAAVKSIDYDIHQNWDMQVEGCSGPAGYQQALEDELRKLFMDKELLQTFLVKPFQEKVNSVVAVLNQQLFLERKIEVAENVQVLLKPMSVDIDEKFGHLLLKGDLVSMIQSDSVEQIVVDTDFNEEDKIRFGSTGFIISQEYIGQIIQILQKKNILSYSFFAQQVSGLKALFANRLYQLFLWPDLLNFKNNSPFSFKVKSAVEPDLHFFTSSEGYSWYNFNAQVLVDTYAPKKSSYVPYGQFQTPIDGKVWLGVHKGSLVAGFHKPKLNLKFLWDQFYNKKFNPFKSLSASYFGSKVQDFLAGKRFTYPLPELQFDDLKLLKPAEIDAQEKWMQIKYSVPST